MKPEFKEGPEARQKFDEGMTRLFRAAKIPLREEKPKPDAKPTGDSKD